MTLQLHNTLTRRIDAFTPLNNEQVTLYTCGPTVYDYLHVGNWAAYIYWDILVRTLTAYGYTVERVMNITDVGHLVSDADEGQDKLEKGARREGKTAWEVARFYGDDFLAGMEKLNLLAPEHITKATDYIPQQLELIRTLKRKGHTYQIDDGIYFDTSTFPAYADFAGLDLEAQKAGARVEFNSEKRAASDFALWKFSPAGERRDMEWETPEDLLESQPTTQPGAGNSAAEQGGAVSEAVMGFPGWHLECSAMAMSILGPTIDIHTGGIDHIPVHHTNEIAQSESASGQRFSNYWLHNNHLKVNGTKISKSLGNGYTLQDLEKRGFSALDYRMTVLQGHYRSEGNFTFENLESAHNRLMHWRSVAALRWQTSQENNADTDEFIEQSKTELLAALGNDLDTPEALRVVDEVFTRLETTPPSLVPRRSLTGLLETVDSLLGLDLLGTTPDIDEDVKQLIADRDAARHSKDWAASDRLRDELLQHRIVLRDTAHGSIWSYA